MNAYTIVRQGGQRATAGGRDVYSSRAVDAEGVACWELAGPDQARCLVVPPCGSQLASLRLSAAPGRQAGEVLLGGRPADLERLGWGAGAPILFPFVGRVRDGRFTYRGQTYRVTTPGRHPLHGYAGQGAWTVSAWGEDARGAWVRTDIERDPERVPAQAFPGIYRVSVVHRLDADGYHHEVTVLNVGTQPFPFAYGWHPYFLAPLGAEGSRADCELRLPAEARWELTPDLLPTGRRIEVRGSYDLRVPAMLGQRSYDDPFTMLEADADGCSRAELIDPHSGLAVEVASGPEFPHWVVYAPCSARAVCLEPYSAIPDAFNLDPQGVPTGLRELYPGQAWHGRIQVRLKSAPRAGKGYAP